MKFNSTFVQRAILAFTTALFLSCAARISYVSPIVPPSAAP